MITYIRVSAKINFSYCFKTSISFNMIDFITIGMQSFEINAYLNNAPLTLTLIVRTLSGLIYKTASCGLNLMRFQRILADIFLDNLSVFQIEIKKTTIGI